MLEWTFSIGNLATLGLILFSIAGFYHKTNSDNALFRETLNELKLEIKDLHKVVVELATQKQRLDSQGDRLNRLDARLDQLREGKGFILPPELYQES